MPLEITGMGSELQGVGRLADGRAVFVPGAIEGETVDIRIVKDKGRFCEAELLKVVKSSPERIVPPCPYCGECGGCRAAHMKYEASLRFKRDKVYQALSRVGGFNSPVVNGVIGMSDPFRYRNKAEYAISGGRIGFRPNNSRKIVEIDDCLLQNLISVKAMRITREWLKRCARPFNGWLVTRTNDKGELMCVLSAVGKPERLDALSDALFNGVDGMRSLYSLRLKSDPVSALDGAFELISGEKSIYYKLNGLDFEIGPASFFQVNASQAGKLYDLALENAGIDGSSRVIDAYCGVGTIALNLAKRAREVVGVESIEQAVLNAGENARINGLDRQARFIAADAAKEIPRLLTGGFAADAIVVDPPRKGVDAALIEAIVKSGIKRVVYVSCDPATLARDMAKICAGGAYRMADATPVDMFCLTSHIECVTCAVKCL